MRVIIVAAADRDCGIGFEGKLPWAPLVLRSDMQHFRTLTMGHPVIMGRKTYESLGAPLPGRPNIVLSKHWGAESYVGTGVWHKSDLDDALEFAGLIGDTAFIIGGASVYTQAMSCADQIDLTMVDGSYRCDTYFPELPDYFELECVIPLASSSPTCEVYRYVRV